MKKIIIGLLLAGCLLFGVSAQSFAFSDIEDAKTASAVMVLKDLGIISGFPDGSFRPEELLTRAQFTKMAITLMGDIDEQLALAAGTTIFPDVKSSHWAVSYINYAAKKERGIINGYPSGYFLPDEPIRYSEAVTILMRLLGYNDASVGLVWPDGYLNAAAACGLTKDIAAGESISRGTAALLFRNMLDCRLKDSESIFLSKLCPGGIVKNAVLMDNKVRTADGSKPAVKVLRAGEEVIIPTAIELADSYIDSELSFALNADSEIQVLISAEKADLKSFLLSAAAATRLTAHDGTVITVPAGQTVIYNGESRAYSSLYLDLQAGSAVKIYYNAAGAILKLYINSAEGAPAQALISEFSTDSNPLPALFGLNGGEYRIIKDGAEAAVSDLELYDSVIFDAAGKSFYISSLKLSGIYEDIEGDYSNPSRIKLMGNWFELAPCAVESVLKYKPSSKAAVTVLVTNDGRVTAMLDRVKVIGREIGIADISGSLTLPNGMVLTGTAENGGAFNGKLAYATSESVGTLQFHSIELKAPNAALAVAERKLGEIALADNAVLYDTVRGYAARKIALGDITLDTIPAEKILHAQYDKNGKVNMLVFDDISGDCYFYGKVTMGYESVSLSGKTLPTYNTYTNGEYCGIAVGPSGYAEGHVPMERLSGFTTASFRNDRELYVSGRIYTVASNATVYLEPMQKYVTLYEARSYGGSVEVYCDAAVGKIRIIVVR